MANIVPDSFKAELLAGSHNFEYGVSAQVFKLALYVTTLGPPYTTSSTVYSTTNEVSSSGTNYSAGGNALTLDTLSGSVPGSNTAIVDFVNLTFSNVPGSYQHGTPTVNPMLLRTVWEDPTYG